MAILRFAVWLVPAAIMTAAAQWAFGQGTAAGTAAAYPIKPIRLFTSEAGGSADSTSRLIAQGLSAGLRQPVIVENRRANVVAEIVAKAPPDGYSLINLSSTIWLAQFMRESVGYDVIADFAPITLAVSSPAILVVHPALPVKSVKELIAHAKAKPGELNYSTGATGGSTHLSAELFKAMAGVNMVRVPYKGSSPAVAALLASDVQLSFTSTTAATPHVKSGKLRALAVTSATPSALAPDLPTVAASGLPGYESTSPHAVFAPANTPAVIITRLNQEIVRALNQAEVKEKLAASGVEVVGSSPEQLSAGMKSEIARLGKVIRDTGIKAE